MILIESLDWLRLPDVDDDVSVSLIYKTKRTDVRRRGYVNSDIDISARAAVFGS